MVRYAANLTLMFQEWSFLDRFEAARDAGFQAVEFGFPTGFEAQRIADQLKRARLHQVLATVPLRSGSKGLAAMPGQQKSFREDMKRALEYAAAAQSPLLHVLSGVAEQPDQVSSDHRFRRNMEWALEQASKANVRLVIEAINQRSVPGYYIRSLADALAWSERLPGLGVILDVYHACMEGLEPVKCIRDHATQCAHLQIAGYPGRNEPDNGSLDYTAVVDAIHTSRYEGWVGCEYLPAASTSDGLTWRSYAGQ